MKRYTRTNLREDVDRLNKMLERNNVDAIMEVAPRYDYTAIDWATKKNAEEYCVNGTVGTGTSRQCLQKAQEFVLARLDS